jgi:hypothetical protein
MKITYHPDKHGDLTLKNRTQKLFDAANKGEIILALESETYNGNKDRFLKPDCVDWNGVYGNFNEKAQIYGIEGCDEMMISRLSSIIQHLLVHKRGYFKDLPNGFILLYLSIFAMSMHLSVSKEIVSTAFKDSKAVEIISGEVDEEGWHKNLLAILSEIEQLNPKLICTNSFHTSIEKISLKYAHAGMKLEIFIIFLLNILNRVWSQSVSLRRFETERLKFEALIKEGLFDKAMNISFNSITLDARNAKMAESLQDIIKYADLPVHVLIGRTHLISPSTIIPQSPFETANLVRIYRIIDEKQNLRDSSLKTSIVDLLPGLIDWEF